MNTPDISHPALKILLDNVNIHKAVAGKETVVCRYNDEVIDLAKEAKKNLDDIIRNLEIEIDASIRNTINALHEKYILIVGKSIRLLEAVGSYVYCMRGHTAINFCSFSGKDDKGIEYILNSPVVYYDGNDKPRTGKLMDCLASDGTVFLGNLKCHARLLLERVASEIGNVKGQYHQNNKGMLIVSTLTPLADIPEYFQSLFEVIELEPGKQSENVRDFMPFPTPAGTMWHEVKISFIDGENVKISIRGNTESRHYSQMGFKDSRSGIKPVKSWNILLLFRENKPLPVPHRDKGRVEDCIRDLRKRLRAYFGIQDDPIIFEHGYKPKFEVSIYEEQSRSVRAFSNSDSFDDKEDD